MKIRGLGFTSFKITIGNIDVVTDPLMTENAGLKFNSTKADVALFTEAQYLGQEGILKSVDYKRLEPGNSGKLFEISSPGDYEVGSVIIRRLPDTEFYVLDEGYLRVVYMGGITKEIKPEMLENLGDVDVLIIPVGDGEHFIPYDKIEKVINNVDPTYLVPSGYKVKGLGKEYDGLKTVDEFVKQFGYTHVKKEKALKVSKGSTVDSKVIEVVVLE